MSFLRITFGSEGDGAFDTGLPVLAGEKVEGLFATARAAGCQGPLALFQADGWLLGAATVPLPTGVEDAAHQLYRSILEVTRSRHLARVWNYVPRINEAGPGGLENYRLFCRGRSLAFEEHYGREFKARLPAASAVGSNAAALTVVFAACPLAPQHVENPLQVPAYEYPADYGPRAPSFARASVVAGESRTTVFISGTAAIRGHATVAPQSVPVQLACALENLQEISRACGLGSELDRGGSSKRHFKVYVRNPGDQPEIAAALAKRLFTARDHISYLQANLCRTALLLEIEASLFGVAATH